MNDFETKKGPRKKIHVVSSFEWRSTPRQKNTYLPQLQRAPIVKVLYKQANIGFAAEAVFFWGGGRGRFAQKKGVTLLPRDRPISEKKNLRKLHMYCKLL